jgi:small subunit ribosomal protein S2
VAVVTTRQLLEAGLHFGHQTRRWNPKMRRYILGERNGIYIIDLQKTLHGLEAAYGYVRDLVAGGGTVLFVGTKKQAQGPIATYATACGMPYINERWLGGTLTNFATISGRTGKLREYEAMERAGDFEAMPKKEALRHRRELDKLRRNLGGIRDLERLPDAIFVIDTKKEHIAVTEANKLGLPIVAVVDTNCDPDLITYVIPGNDDAIRAGTLMCSVMAEAVKEGRWIAAHRPVSEPAPAASSGRSGPRGAARSDRTAAAPVPSGSPAATAPVPPGASSAETAATAGGPPAESPSASVPSTAAAAPATPASEDGAHETAGDVVEAGPGPSAEAGADATIASSTSEES